MIFFAGVSLTLGSTVSLLQHLPGDFSLMHPDRALQSDYQESSRFRGYITGHLETFLAMAANSFGESGYYNHYYGYSGYGYPGDYAVGALEGPSTIVGEAVSYEGDDEALEDVAFELYRKGMSDQEIDEYLQWLVYSWETGVPTDYWWDLVDPPADGERGNPPTDDERAQQRRRTAQRYHDSIKKDENLLYSIAYDGEVLYSNSQALPTDGELTAPEGYNFLLYYADGRVRILKDGKELDIYGDGCYREDNEWYVPGYRNFTVDEDMKKAVIYMAAAKEPVLYSESSYGKGSYRQLDNSLYWMQYNTMSNRKILLRNLAALAIGLAFLAAALLCRKSRREAARDIARFTGKIWIECKVLFFAVILSSLLGAFFLNFYRNYGFSIVDGVRAAVGEITYYYDSGYSLSAIGSSILRYLLLIPSGTAWVLLFWLAYLAVNDLRHNPKGWRCGLIARLHRTFTARDLTQPLPVKTARRNAAAFIAALIYGLLMLAGGVNGYQQSYHARGEVWGIGSLFFLVMVGFLAFEYVISKKNMETARDIEALSGRIRDIREGNYTNPLDGERMHTVSPVGDEKEYGEVNNSTSPDNQRKDGGSSSLAGHDLEDAMTWLEDIRHGMGSAVDEQMRSERMKVELIANVSHDIKTPLTSIISYVQFLKEEKELPEHVRDYVMILDEKSQRLKNMVQDVFAVSKAASGELPMHMEKLDFGKLLRQTMADMEEQIERSKVTFRTEFPDAPVMIRADGQRLYRVFQNLFQNAIQYSLDGSRVFVTLQSDGNLAVASVKNTSRQELERDKDFAERFARGDQSRTDGGSGLGLSIAQSFTEACGGSFHWETNADLFVVTVSFRTLQGQQNDGFSDGAEA